MQLLLVLGLGFVLSLNLEEFVGLVAALARFEHHALDIHLDTLE